MKMSRKSLGALTHVATGERWEATRLASEIDTRATCLRRSGIGRRDNVLLAHGGTPEFFVDLLAIWEVGACAVCVNPAITRSERDTIVDFVKPKLLVSGSNDLVQKGAAPIAADRAAVLRTNGADDALADPALILFTSGSTGIPKGVVHSFRALFARLSSNRENIPSHERRVTLCPLPTHFGHGLIGNSLTSLLDGGHVLIASNDLKTVSILGDLVDDHGVTFMSSVPTFWKIAAKFDTRRRGASLRRVHVGSAPLSKALWSNIIEWAGTRNVVNMYGMTETANWVAGASAAEFEPDDGLVGIAWGAQIAVKKQDSSIVNTGSGEVLIKSPSLMEGYYQRPDLTQDAFINGWLRTGDLGELDSRSVLRLTGRIKHEINRAGMKVNPEDIEMLLERSGAIEDVCAFGMADELSGETIGVVVVPADRANFNLQNLKAWCAERLVREKQPEKWFVADHIPKNERGKVNRAQLAQKYVP